MEHPPDPFDRLPDEVFQLIFGAVRDCKSLVRCMAVSRSFKAQSIRVPFLSIVCPGSFSSYDAKLKGVYAMVKEFQCLETLIVRVGQPKDEPPSWARCMRYAEIGASVEKFVFMAAKSGDFSEFDVELIEGDAALELGRSASFKIEEEESWEGQREEVLSRERERSPRRWDGSQNRRDALMGGSAPAECTGTDSPDENLPSSNVSGTAATSQVERRTACNQALGSAKGRVAQLESQVISKGKQHSFDTNVEESDSGLDEQCQKEKMPNVKRDERGKRACEEPCSSGAYNDGMPGSSDFCEADEIEEGVFLPSNATADGSEDTLDPVSQENQVRSEDERAVDDMNIPTTSSPEASSFNPVVRRLQNTNARPLFCRRFLEQNRYRHDKWDFGQERGRLPEFVLRQVVAPSNDVLKRMVPVIVFAIVQGLDEFRDSVPTFMSRFAGLKRFILVDMVESLTIYMREHQIKEIRDQGAPQREGYRESRGSGTQDDSERERKQDISLERRKSRNEDPDVRAVENLPNFPFEGSSDREKWRSTRRRVLGKGWKDGRTKGSGIRVMQESPDRGKQELALSEDNNIDDEIRRWKGKEVSNESASDKTGMQSEERCSDGESNTGFRSTVDESSLTLAGNRTSGSLDPKEEVLQASTSMPLTSPSSLGDDGGWLFNSPVCGNCGLASNYPSCESMDCPIRCRRDLGADTGTGKQENEVVGRDSGDDGPSENYTCLGDVVQPNTVMDSSENVISLNEVKMSAELSKESVTERWMDGDSGECSSSSIFLDKSGSDAPMGTALVSSSKEAGGNTGESSSEGDTKDRSWLQFFDRPGSGTVTSERNQLQGMGLDIFRPPFKKGVKLENILGRKENKSARKGRDDARGLSLRRSHRVVAERRGWHLSLPGQLASEYADELSVGESQVKSLNTGASHAAEQVQSSRSSTDADGLTSIAPEHENPEAGIDATSNSSSYKGKRIVDDEDVDNRNTPQAADTDASSTLRASSRLLGSGGFVQEGTSAASFGLQTRESRGLLPHAETEESSRSGSGSGSGLTDKRFGAMILGAPVPGSGDSPQDRMDNNSSGLGLGLGWIHLREVGRDRPRASLPPFERLPRERSNERETWRERLGRRVRDFRRDGDGDRGRDSSRRERMREGVRKRQRDIEREALYFDISFWRAEQVVAHRYCLSDVSMCVATHSARPLSSEELDILSRAALAGPLLTATIGYVNKQVASHNL